MAPMKTVRKSRPGESVTDTFSLSQLAKRWSISRRQVRQLLQSRQLPFVQIRGELRVPRTAVLKFELATLDN